MIKISFKTLIGSYNNLKKVAEFNYLIETRFRMAKALMYVEQEKALYDKQYKDLLKRHGEPASPNHYNINKENLEAYLKELDELQAIEVQIPVERLLHTNVQDQIESPADMVALSWLIIFPELEEVKADAVIPTDEAKSAEIEAVN